MREQVSERRARPAEMTYATFSGWIERPDDVLPPLREDITCDVAVIGGGLCGMAAALRLAERNVDVVLVEAEFCGYGASSRNAGQLSANPGVDARLLSERNPGRLRNLVGFAQRAVHFDETLMQQLEVDCEYQPTGNTVAALSRGQLRKAREYARLLMEAGQEARFGDHRELGLPDAFPGGLFKPLGGTLNPGKFTRGIRQALLRSGVRVFEQTPVQSLDDNGGGVVIRAPDHQVRAGRVILATNAYLRELATTSRHLATPIWVNMVETAPVEPQRLAATGWSSRCGIVTDHNIMESYRPTARNSIVLGVRQLRLGRGRLDARTSDPAVVADLRRAFHRRFPTLRDVPLQRTWGGWIAMLPSHTPAAGPLGKNLFYASGCNGHGLAQAPYSGSLLADWIATGDAHDDLRTIWQTRTRYRPSWSLNAPALRSAWIADRLADCFR